MADDPQKQGKESKPEAHISFFVRNEAAGSAMARRKVIDRNNEEHEAVVMSWNWRDTWQNEHKRAFVVAKMAKADMLTEVRDSLQKALDEGVPFEQWKKEIVPKLEGKWLGKSVGQLWDELSEEEKAKRTPPSEKERDKVIGSERLELIFRTNMAVANAAGHYEQLMKTKAIYPYWRYVTRDDARVRDDHRALHNKVFKWDDPFWETYFPPNGFRCRCHVSPLTKRQVERDPKLHIEQSNITEDADGRKVLDVGGSYYKNNPGWDYNPGDSVNHLVSLAKSNEKGRPAQVQADLEADLAKKEAEEAAAAKAKAEAEEQRKAEEARRAEAERQAKEAAAKAEAERQAKEAAAKAEAERQAKEAAAKAEAERQQRLEKDFKQNNQSQEQKPQRFANLASLKDESQAQIKSERGQFNRLHKAEKQKIASQNLLVQRLMQGKKINFNALPKIETHNTLEGIYNGNIKYYNNIEDHKAKKVDKKKAIAKQIFKDNPERLDRLAEGAYQNSKANIKESVKEQYDKLYSVIEKSNNLPSVEYNGRKPIILTDDEKNKIVDSVVFYEPSYNNVEDAQNAIYEKTLEHAIVFDKDHRCLAETVGHEGKVDFNANSRGIAYMVIHNHPNGTIFSPDDIVWALESGIHELRVVCNGDGIYAFYPYEYGKPNIVGKKFEEDLKNLLIEEVDNKLQSLLNEGSTESMFMTVPSYNDLEEQEKVSAIWKEQSKQFVKDYVAQHFPGMSIIQ